MNSNEFKKSYQDALVNLGAIEGLSLGKSYINNVEKTISILEDSINEKGAQFQNNTVY